MVGNLHLIFLSWAIFSRLQSFSISSKVQIAWVKQKRWQIPRMLSHIIIYWFINFSQGAGIRKDIDESSCIKSVNSESVNSGHWPLERCSCNFSVLCTQFALDTKLDKYVRFRLALLVLPFVVISIQKFIRSLLSAQTVSW